MKKESGVTLITLIVYIIALMIVISILATVSDMFFSNTKFIKENSKNIAEFNKFNMYFLEDVKNNKNTYSVTSTEIIFEDGTKYTYKESPDNSIYRNKIKICTNIAYCSFSQRQETINNTNKNIISVHIAIKADKIFETTNDYALKYW